MTALSTRVSVFDSEIPNQSTVGSGRNQYGNLPVEEVVQEDLMSNIGACSELLAGWTASYNIPASRGGEASLKFHGMMPEMIGNCMNVTPVEHPWHKAAYILYITHERHEPYMVLVGIGNNEQPNQDTSLKNRESREPSDLMDALLDLYDVQRIAEEDGDIPPSNYLLERFERILRDIYAVSPRPYAIYPMPDGEIAIDAHTPHGTKVVVVCSDDSARCLVYTDEGFQQQEYGDLSVVPDRFIVESLEKTQVRSFITSRE